MLEKVLIASFCVIAGVFFVLTGIKNIKTKEAKETGKRIITNKMLGQGNNYTGDKAILLGRIRIITGILIIIFGIIFLFTGPFLK